MGQKQQAAPTLGKELAAVLGISFALFLLICYLGYSLPEISGNQTGTSLMWGGKIGSFIAESMMSFLGITSFWVPLLLLIFSFQLFSPVTSFGRLPYIFAGCSGILIASSGLLGTTGIASVTLFGRRYPAAGYLGNLLHTYLGTYFGGPGSVVLLAALFIISLMVSVRFSPYFCGRRIAETYGVLREKYPIRPAALFKRQAAEKDNARITGRKPAAPAIEQHDEQDIIVPSVHEPVQLPLDDGAVKEDFKLLPLSTGEYRLPSLTLLDKPEKRDIALDRDYYLAVSRELEAKLLDFGVSGKVVGISPGPVITTYEFSPAPGVKINKIVSLADDIALGLKAESVRIVGSIPGKAALGIEIPNPERNIVHIRDILANERFQKTKSKLTIGLGMDVVGNPVVADLAKMPHLLIAGATGSGKSVAVNVIICSILFNATPEEVRLLMVDPKRIELSCYEAIPHLLHPVVVDPRMASRALHWAVREMERRYELMEEAKVKSIATYNEVAEEKLPLIVIIIDELADLMMVSSKEVEDAVARLAQMARAAGMHLILATQRPSVDVLTGLIKANFPTRMSFKVSSKIDSRTILDTTGAEHLLGSGDMLFSPPGTARIQRIHGAYISEQETERIVQFLKEQGMARYDESVLQEVEEPELHGEGDDEDFDEKYDEAVALVCETGQASISMVQRRLRVGYNRAARMIEVMEKEGIVGPADGSKPRDVLARKSY